MLAPLPESELINIAWDRISSAATEQTREDMSALFVCHGDIESAAELELYSIATLWLRSQGRIDDVIAYKLVKPELIWAALYPHLRSVGYDIHNRYAIGWTDRNGADKHPSTPWANYSQTMPATQSSSGRKVMLKIMCTRPEYLGGEEMDILEFLNHPTLRRHPDNAAVDLLEVLDLPTLPHGERLAGHFKIIVMPFLRSLTFGDCFDTGSTLDLMRQAFVAVAFLHSHGICHRYVTVLLVFSTADSLSSPQ
ncbi:hypothetical protein EXIGLDRAFT_775711 [Exidia glandulosa HHB12029]|uniref:Protein kinase domain-containing protein n=1 Tax=Exidia glandulosa HHB12029 TaxID=1314781 RepID=A0A165DSW3_EXIGL|nr:hypothetical protein EXIGLDRAFT_775711 [Exidia glandulosa HHB12029]